MHHVIHDAIPLSLYVPFSHPLYRRAGNFRGQIFVTFVVAHWSTNILTTDEATLPAVQAATTKILTTNLQPRILIFGAIRYRVYARGVVSSKTY